MLGRLSTDGGSRHACKSFAIMLVLAVLVSSPVSAAPVVVRFSEGATHGFLLVRSLAGDIIGQGELTQMAKEGGLVESQLVFRFNDGSLHDEKVAFSQKGVFTLISYHLIQRGPSFPEQIDMFIDRGTREYRVRSKVGEDGIEEMRTGIFDLPDDVYNGMVVTMMLNLGKGVSGAVHILAFKPEPEVIKVQIIPTAQRTVRIGSLSRKAVRYVFKPDIGMIEKWVGRLIGELPEQFHYHCWVLADEIPSFVHYEGPLQLMGPIVRIELVSPGLLEKSEVAKRTSH